MLRRVKLSVAACDNARSKIPPTFDAKRFISRLLHWRVAVHSRLMPDSAVNPARLNDLVPLADDPAVSLPRPARQMQRGSAPDRVPCTGPYGAPTLDLFAEDAERATLQALNTDIRQATLPGFELPDVFMAAVSAVSASALPSTSRRAAVSDDAGAYVLPNESATENAAPTLDLLFDEPRAKF